MGGDLIREARKRAGLTQRELAERAGTTQSAVARWEAGRSAPSFETVRRLVRLCGLDLEVAIVPYDDSDLSQALANLELTPEERLDQHSRWVGFVHEARRAFEEQHGAA